MNIINSINYAVGQMEEKGIDAKGIVAFLENLRKNAMYFERPIELDAYLAWQMSFQKNEDLKCIRCVNTVLCGKSCVNGENK